MVDSLSPKERSEIMARVRSKDTRPEMRIRKLAFALGYRYRLHDRKLPGCPDLVFGPRRKVIFVHGCFWHRHQGCKQCYTPKSNVDFWLAKFTGNIVRDQKNMEVLRKAGWRVVVVWECELGAPEKLQKRLWKLLESSER